jgi:hypothetical protein
MDYDVVTVEPRGEHRLWVKFRDGVAGEVDFARLLAFDGVFSSLRDPEEFRRARVNHDLGIIEWPSGADFDSVVLHRYVEERSQPRRRSAGSASSD